MASIFSKLFNGASRRQTFADLLELDDHLLRDIGITRYELQQSLRDRRGRRTRAWTHE